MINVPKRVTSNLAKGFICERCVEAMKGIVESAVVNILCPGGAREVFVAWGTDQKPIVEVKQAVTARTRMGCVIFTECGKLPSEKKLSLQIKE